MRTREVEQKQQNKDTLELGCILHAHARCNDLMYLYCDESDVASYTHDTKYGKKVTCYAKCG